MPTGREQIAELLGQIDHLPFGQQVAPAERAQALADELGDDELRAAARISLLRAYNYSADRTRMFAPFSWLLQRYDEQPAWFGDYERFIVLWTYKWMIHGLLDHPDVPLTQLHASLDGMRRRYAEAGVGLQPVLGAEYHLTAHLHGADAARDAFAQWSRAERNDFSDCLGCEPTDMAHHHAELGDHVRAVETVESVLEGSTQCAEQPQAAIAAVLASLLLTGQTARAATVHLTGSRISRSNPDETDYIAAHLHVLARSGELGRGLDLLSERLADVAAPPTPWAGMQLAAAGARLLSAVIDAGHGDLEVRARGAAQAEPVPVLRARLERHATDLAARFDARNGTPRVSRLVQSWLTAEPLPPLPLGAAGRRLGHSAPDAAASRAGAPGVADDVPLRATHPRAPRLDDLPALDGAADPADLADLAERAEASARFAHRSTTEVLLAHYLARREHAVARFDRPEAAEADRRHLAELEYLLAWGGRRGPLDAVAREGARRAVRLYRSLGEPAQALLIEQFVAATDDDRPRVLSLIAGIDAVGDPLERARARTRALVGLEDGPGGVTAHDLAVAGLDLLGPVTPDDAAPRRAVAARLLLSELDDPAAPGAFEQAGQVLALVPEDHVDLALSALIHQVHARLMSDPLDAPEVEPLLVEAERRTVLAGAGEGWARVQLLRAQIALAEGDFEAAEQRLTAAVAGLERVDSPVGVAEARSRLAGLLHGQGRPLEAIEVVEAGLAQLDAPEPPATLEPVQRNAFSWHLAQLQRIGSRVCVELGESERALDLARRVVNRRRQLPDRAGLADALYELAGLLADESPLEALTTYAAALDEAQLAGDAALDLVIRRERVWARTAADGVEAALADVDEAQAAGERWRERMPVDPTVADSLADWDFDWEPLALHELRVRLLAADEQAERALAMLEAFPGGLGAAMRAQGVDLGAAELDLLHGRLLLDCGREQAGVALVEAAVEVAREHGHDGLQQAGAAAVARWLDEQGRPDEAEVAWERLAGEQA